MGEWGFYFRNVSSSGYGGFKIRKTLKLLKLFKSFNQDMTIDSDSLMAQCNKTIFEIGKKYEGNSGVFNMYGDITTLIENQGCGGRIFEVGLTGFSMGSYEEKPKIKTIELLKEVHYGDLMDDVGFVKSLNGYHIKKLLIDQPRFLHVVDLGLLKGL